MLPKGTDEAPEISQTHNQIPSSKIYKIVSPLLSTRRNTSVPSAGLNGTEKKQVSIILHSNRL